jgi:hypothetical protein
MRLFYVTATGWLGFEVGLDERGAPAMHMQLSAEIIGA